MPVRRTSLRRRHHESTLTVEHVEFLFTGHSGGGLVASSPFQTEDAARACWEGHRDGLMELWLNGGDRNMPFAALGLDQAATIAEPNPWTAWNWQALCDFVGEGLLFSRPWAWWRWDAPEPHRRADDAKTWEVEAHNEALRERVALWHETGPRNGLPRSPGLARFESEHAYLARHGLLAEVERKYLAAVGRDMLDDAVYLELRGRDSEPGVLAQ